MSNPVETRLSVLGLTLPEAPAPLAAYVPFVRVGDMLYVSGQVSSDASGLIVGQLGRNLDIDAGQKAAARCALSLLAQVRMACDGDLSRLVQVVKLNAFVNSAPDFTDQPAVVNGASNLLGDVLGEPGKHARSAVGVAQLPFGVAVEIDGIFRIS